MLLLLLFFRFYCICLSCMWSGRDGPRRADRGYCEPPLIHRYLLHLASQQLLYDARSWCGLRPDDDDHDEVRRTSYSCTGGSRRKVFCNVHGPGVLGLHEVRPRRGSTSWHRIRGRGCGLCRGVRNKWLHEDFNTSTLANSELATAHRGFAIGTTPSRATHAGERSHAADVSRDKRTAV
jgi:hypothetical protein